MTRSRPPLPGPHHATGRTPHDPGHGHYDLGHHGDQEATEGLVDLAVNVRQPRPPDWLAGVVTATTGDLAAYPEPTAARAALARWHGVSEEMVLPTSGAAEAFTLIARAGLAGRALVVHPQFTEPEAALHRARVPVRRHLLRAEDGFRLVLDERAPGAGAGGSAGAGIDEAGLTVIGNPTNPTGVLHTRAALEQLHERLGGVLVVDEAFLDEVVGGERESLIGPSMRRVLVVRSLTKTWGLAGLRAGYVVGDPDLVERLTAEQPPWSVSTPALAVMVATATPEAAEEAARLAGELVPWREHLVAGLRGLGVRVVEGVSPFVLAEVGVGVREELRARGYAVRRGDTFPGLDESWVRIAVRTPEVTDGLLTQLTQLHRTRQNARQNT